MRFLIASLFFVVTAAAQTPKMITFNQADKEHCKVVQFDGKPLLESTYDGTSVAIAMPINRGNDGFLVFVAIYRAAPGSVEVNPEDFYGVFSDAAHTRFAFYETASEPHAPSGDSSMSANRAGIDPGSLRPGAQLGGPPAGAGPMPSAAPGRPSSGGAAASAYLQKHKIKHGEKIAGWVTLRPAKGTSVDVHSTDMLDEVNIAVNGVVFRF